MKLWLQESGQWKLFEGDLTKELASRNITVGEGAKVGARATVGEWATVGEGANIKRSLDCIVMGPLGSREAMMTAYRHKDEIWIGTGCFLGNVEDFETAVRKNHAGNEHEREYLCAIEYVRNKFLKGGAK